MPKFVAAQVTRARDAIDRPFDEPGTDLETAGDDCRAENLAAALRWPEENFAPEFTSGV